MKKILLLIVFALATQFAMAQKFSIKGKVVDETGSGLPSATVMILSQKDSALVSFKGTNLEGAFEIVNINQGSYLLKVTYIGYNNFFKTITSQPGTPALELGDLKLQPSSAQLDEVKITGEANPVTVKRDTIEFNAGSFKTAVNANVEDLLKKLPGVEVDSDGGITAQGETVQQVLVDGREFFGRDPKLATRGLPADAVKSVQVFDKKSDQARFSGVDDGVRQKTINLELKEDRRNMTFGNAMAGGGADVKDSKLALNSEEDGRFTAKASINKFGKGKQLSIVAMGNNINEQGFTASDLGGGGGGGGQGGGQGGQATGIATNYAAGINYNKDLSKKSKLTSNYFYNYTNRNLTTATLQDNIQGDLDQTNAQLNTTNNHRVNLRIDQEIDSTNSLTVIANPTYTETRSTNATQSVTYSPDNTQVIKAVDQDNLTSQKNANLTSSLLWRHRFSRPGRTLSTNGAFSYTDANLDGTLTSDNTNYGVLTSVAQSTVQKSSNQTYGVTATYTEPLGTKNNKYLEATYDFSANVNQLDKEVSNMLDGGSIIPALSNKYNNTIMVNRPYVSFRFTAPLYNVSVGMGYQNTKLDGEFVLTQVPINYSFQNFLPAVRANYDFTQFKHLRFNYQTAMQTPSFTQLNPVPDNSNQANISIGNPDLAPSYSHSGTLNYTAFNPNKFINFFATASANYGLNSIVNSQTTTTVLDANGNRVTTRSTQPVNVKNSTNLNANFNFGFPITKLKSRFNVGPNARYSKSLSVNSTNNYGVVTEIQGSTEQTAFGGRAGYNLTFGTIYSLDLSANLNYSETKYEVSPNQNQKFFNKVFQAQSNLKFLKSYTFNGTFTYSMTNTISSNYKLNVPLLNLSVSRLVFKNQAGEVKLGVNNVLNRAQSVQQSVDVNTGSLTTTRYNNLGRYFMVSFTYALNKNLNPAAGRGQGGPPGGGGFRD